MHTGHWLNLTDRKDKSITEHATLLAATCLIMVPAIATVAAIGIIIHISTGLAAYIEDRV